MVVNPAMSYDKLIDFFESPIIRLYKSFNPHLSLTCEVYRLCAVSSLCADDVYLSLSNVSRKDIDLSIAFLLKHRFLFQA